MVILGTALLSVCFLLGVTLGDILGKLIGVKANVGGVGIAMLLLIFARLTLGKRELLAPATLNGVHYWGAMYIPVVVAMAATQNTLAALRGGRIALLAAVGSVALCVVTISVINRLTRDASDDAWEAENPNTPPV